jgi:hypothetical protein
MSEESDAAIGIILGIIGGAILAFLLGKMLEPKADCPVCGNIVTKGSEDTSICPGCNTQLRWD